MGLGYNLKMINLQIIGIDFLIHHKHFLRYKAMYDREIFPLNNQGGNIYNINIRT